MNSLNQWRRHSVIDFGSSRHYCFLPQHVTNLVYRVTMTTRGVLAVKQVNSSRMVTVCLSAVKASTRLAIPIVKVRHFISTHCTLVQHHIIALTLTMRNAMNSANVQNLLDLVGRSREEICHKLKGAPRWEANKGHSLVQVCSAPLTVSVHEPMSDLLLPLNEGALLFFLHECIKGLLKVSHLFQIFFNREFCQIEITLKTIFNLRFCCPLRQLATTLACSVGGPASTSVWPVNPSSFFKTDSVCITAPMDSLMRNISVEVGSKAWN